ncbi:MAG: Bacterial regulatory protein gntR family [Actinomycetia bacterium]|nr:Bacterial regulatory protein gntR family [Actinomycetes bacterium]
MTATRQQPPGQRAPALPARPASPAAQTPSAAYDPRLYVRIATDLRGKLHAGAITAGTTLPITGLARSWGASRETVRKALRALESDGLIRLYPRYGYRVLPAPGTTPATEGTQADGTSPPAGSY